jgi:sulfur-oxidizing protein SoxY
VEISVDSPMTEKDYCESVTLIATKNPNVYVATFKFTPDSGKAWVSTRMRLAQTQEVWALAKMSDGKFHIAKTTVKVTIGGCGG